MCAGSCWRGCSWGQCLAAALRGAHFLATAVTPVPQPTPLLWSHPGPGPSVPAQHTQGRSQLDSQWRDSRLINHCPRKARCCLEALAGPLLGVPRRGLEAKARRSVVLAEGRGCPVSLGPWAMALTAPPTYHTPPSLDHWGQSELGKESRARQGDTWPVWPLPCVASV